MIGGGVLAYTLLGIDWNEVIMLCVFASIFFFLLNLTLALRLLDYASVWKLIGDWWRKIPHS
tara:strand:- start:1013 stop:1198 length:186 start_codon:yes stop_codon:yes gene_type:complete